jgi:alpha-galactosidase
MGWMFVPLTQYHGGGAAATIEPLCEHLDHYEARLSNLFGAGVQACYRGPRIYDTDDTKALVKKWVSFYKAHREVLDADIIHLRRPDGRDWDGFVHVNPQGKEKALAFFYNPLEEAIEREISVPLYYAGLSDAAVISVNGEAPKKQKLNRDYTVTLTVKIPARGRTWILFTET